MINNGGPRYKRSTLEKLMNQDIIWCCVILMILCIVGAIGVGLWLKAFKDLGEPYITGDLTVYSDAFLAFWTYMIILQVRLPSLFQNSKPI